MKKLVKLFTAVLMIVSLLITGFSVASVASPGRETVVNWNSGRNYRLFVPSGYTPGEALPLVVMLHGCAQTATEFSNGTRMNQIAEQYNFIVMYPEQSTAANSTRCWNWFEPAHQRRGSGEPQIIVDMIRHVQSNFTVDDSAIFASGLSAGGAMAVTLGVLYPDVFSAIAPFAGLQYQAGTSMLNAFSAMNPGNTAVAPATAARNASNQVPANGRSVVPTIIFHGASDFTVVPRASENIVTQMLEYNRLHGATIGHTPETRNGSANGLNYSVQTFRNANGDQLVEFHRITGLGHAWSGGNGAIAHTDSRGPNASLLSWHFFMRTMGEQTTPPPPCEVNPNLPECQEPVLPPCEVNPNLPECQEPVLPPCEVNPNLPECQEPALPPCVEYVVVRANVNQHSLAGRIPPAQFNGLFILHGPMGAFNMYQVVGTNVWTTTRPVNGC